MQVQDLDILSKHQDRVAVMLGGIRAKEVPRYFQDIFKRANSFLQPTGAVLRPNDLALMLSLAQVLEEAIDDLKEPKPDPGSFFGETEDAEHQVGPQAVLDVVPNEP